MVEVFDHLPDGRAVQGITLSNGKLQARVLTLGAIVQDLRLASRPTGLVLGYERIAPYLTSPGRYVGGIVGRFANRIGNASFTLDGQTHQLDRNFLDRHILHGGSDGIDLHLWDIRDHGESHVTLALTLPDGHMGFPSALEIVATIALEGMALSFDISATSDGPTVCNLAHHGYFNLDGGGDVRNHRLQIAAEHYLPVDSDLIPTGELAPVAGTVFDFRAEREIGTAPYDHNFCLSPERAPLRAVAKLTGTKGLSLTVETTEAGLQIYDARHFSGDPARPETGPAAHAGLAMETQNWPDAPNKPQFPDAVLRKGETYRNQTRFVLSEG